MSNPSFALAAAEQLVPGTIAGTAPNQTASYILSGKFWTSRGNSIVITRRVDALPFPLVALTVYTLLKNLATQIQAAEDAIANAAIVPSVLAPYMGNRYDATLATPTIIAPANTPNDTNSPPLGGG